MFCRLLLCILLFCSAPALASVPPSVINLSVETTAVDLAAIVNRTLPQELYKGQGGLGTSLRVQRNGQVMVSAADGFIFVTVPVQLTFSYGFYESSPMRVGLKFKVRVDVTPDWRLRADLHFIGLSDALPETLRLGPLVLKPKGVVEIISLPVQRLLAPVVDTRLNNLVQLPTRVSSFWQQAFTPVLVSKEYGVWLKLNPERIVISPLYAYTNQIKLSVGVISGVEVVVGPPPAAAPLRPLPPAQLVNSFDRQFHLQLASDIFLHDLSAVLQPVLLNKTFGDDKKVTVKQFSLKGEDGRLVVTLTTTGDFDGELTVLAKPVHDAKNNRLTFEQVDFDTRNAGWLISAGSWLFSSSVRSTIKNKLDGAVVEQLEKARQQATAAISTLRVADRLHLVGAVQTLALGEATVLTDRISVQVIASGEVGAVLK